MRRREFITLVGRAATAWPIATRAEQPARLPTIGLLGSAPSVSAEWVAAFVQRLSELRWVVGSTVAIEYRWAEGRNDRFAEFAAEFVRLKVDAIVLGGTQAALAAMQLTSVIPIVFVAVGDPVASGLVVSLARPGGNVTGLSNQTRDLAGKRIEILREVIPGLRRLAILANVENVAVVLEMRDAHAAARTLGYEVIAMEIRRAEDIAAAFGTMSDRADAIYVVIDPLVNTNRLYINDLALSVRMPTMHGGREGVEAGGLISYGPNFPELWRRSAEYIDKILRGVKPADIPVEQPTKFDLVINLKTAKALGLTVPAPLLTRADEVIE
ncbi:ABC transporter substrate-binding protein [Bradyrhizobium erythrophlei]|uniref:Putative ABC transport system substrate-binding protein n=1 Tax=Bradyrhizobium erythrophlei TaxID=1437360 RepID=A0A1M5Y6S3_9BRAD|nr:ABC transporter substrate-binding protein [Bradyrhizobium erythrophlei]SHI07791.1 putative ABC transport system substrate-binding protein [Bradyrhizobium erythrophlei]